MSETRGKSRPAADRTGETSDVTLLYAMATSVRALLWSVRLVMLLVVAGGVVLFIDFHAIIFKVLGSVFCVLGVLAFFLSRRSVAPALVRAEIKGMDLVFRRWDRTEIRVSRKGRQLRKDPRPNGAYVLLHPSDRSDFVALLKQDKAAMEMLADLEKRGVVRGAGSGKDQRMLPPHLRG